ncbi:MAG: GTP cyclohydrolase [Myxococcales bacterium]|nr:GTP cyclohydrolase [Myxococcales bacterium]
MDRAAAAKAIEDFLRALGHAAEGELTDTPSLVASAWCDDLLAGYAADPVVLLKAGAIPTHASRDLIVLRDLDVALMCPHHLLPAHGCADIVILPGKAVAGFGSLASTLFLCTRRLALQESAGAHVAATIVEALAAEGALCRLRLVHTCLAIRGAQHPRASVETIAFAGTFATSGRDRDAALAVLLGGATQSASSATYLSGKETK